MNRFFVTGAVALPFVVACSSQEVKTPNVIFILADDLGYGDLGCTGQTHFETPEIDALAASGVMFTQHYAGCSVSAPSRSSLVTGLHSGHSPIRGNKEIMPEGQYPLPAGTFNVFRMMKNQGYATGVFGKWGLGYPGSEGRPSAQGVDEFFGYNCQRMAHTYYPEYLWHNDEKFLLEGNAGENASDYAQYLIHDRSLDFIRENADKPFFLMITAVLPHAELRIPEKEKEQFKGKFQPEKVYGGCVPGSAGNKAGDYARQEECHEAFAAMVSLLDRQVGDVRRLLDSLGIADNTLVIFTSDNGPHSEGGADPEYFRSSGGFRGIKRDLYEGGIRVPFIASWPGVIEEGVSNGHISAFWDFLPTMAELSGADVPVCTDGISYLPSLTGRGRQTEHEYLYWEFHESGGRQAVRQGDWKYVVYNVKENPVAELYNLAADPAETVNLVSEHPDIVKRMHDLLSSARTESDVFKF